MFTMRTRRDLHRRWKVPQWSHRPTLRRVCGQLVPIGGLVTESGRPGCAKLLAKRGPTEENWAVGELVHARKRGCSCIARNRPELRL